MLKNTITRCLSALALFSSMVGIIQAQPDITRTFDIAAQPAAAALNEFARQADITLVFSYELVSGSETKALKGNFSIQTALDRMLDGTALAYRRLGDNTVAISKKTDKVSAAEGSLQLAQASGVERTDNSPASTKKQEEQGALDEVVVTGSNIRGIAATTSPLIVLDSEYIKRTGYGNTAELFRSLPQNFTGGDVGASEDGRFGAGSLVTLNTTSATGVNLRGLGSTSTLLLVNGHRVAPSSYGSVADISHIPLTAIDRVEILTDGSSAIYGSDAVAGVVNIILKKDYEGAETRARFGSVTEGSREDKSIAQSLGRAWTSGNVMLALSHQKQSHLQASDRDFMKNYVDPTYLFPDSTTSAGAFNVRQEVGSRIVLHSDALYSERHLKLSANRLGVWTATDTRSNNTGVNAGARYKITNSWSADLNATYGKESGQRHIVNNRPTRVDLDNIYDLFEQKSADILLTGNLMDFPSGSLGLAVGSSYRAEEFDAFQFQKRGGTTTETNIYQSINRHVSAAFGEIHVPLISEKQAIPLARALELSAALRYDDYSDVGCTTNPRLGVRWSMNRNLSLMASYGSSFRAPHVAQTVASPIAPSIIVTSFANPNGAGQVPAFILTGGSLPLNPEKADTKSFGLELTLPFVKGLKFTANYYDIDYEDRIVTPAIDNTALLITSAANALVSALANDAAAASFRDSIVASGGLFQDALGSGVSGVRYIYDIRQRNAAALHQSGFDAGIDYEFQLGSGTLSARANFSNIRYIDIQLLPGAPSSDIADIYGNPADWRGRVDVGWGNSVWTIGGAFNYVDEYVNASVAGRPPVRTWITMDAIGSVNLGEQVRGGFLRGTTLNVSVQNITDEDPPFVASTIGANYDASNANPLGRFIAIEIRRRW